MTPFSLFRTGLVAVATLASLPALAADPTTAYQGHVPLTLEGAGPYYRLVLPFEAHRDTLSDHLADVRVLDAGGVEQPYALRPIARQSSQAEKEITARLFPLRAPSDDPNTLPGMTVRSTSTGTVVEIGPDTTGATPRQTVLRGWLLDLGDDGLPLDRLTLDWTAGTEGFHVFSIEASDDLRTWTRLGEAQVGRLTFNDQLIEQNDARLCCTTSRYLRLLWSNSGDAPTVTKATVTGTISGQDPYSLTWGPDMTGRLEPPPEGALPQPDATFVWDLPGRLSPVQVDVTLPHPLTLAPVIAEGRKKDAMRWSSLGHGFLYRMTDSNTQETVEQTLTLSPRPVDLLQLKVDTRGGGLGTDTPQIKIAVAPVEVIFLARGNAPYTLVSGQAEAEDRSLPPSTLIPGYGNKDTPFGVAKPADNWSSHPAIPVVVEDHINFQAILLPGILVLGALVLVGMAIALMKGMSKPE